MNAMNAAEVKAMLERVTETVIAAEPILTDADRALGDGDHGLGMKRGMEAAREALAGCGTSTVDEPLAAMGRAMVSSMGGASGAIFGTLFRSSAKAVKGQESLDSNGFASMLETALTDIQARGGAKPGDKTMIDALAPAAAKARELADQPLGAAMAAVAEAAESGRDASKDMVATMGRAKTLGERSVGHPDAGAVSVAIIFRTMSDFAS